MSPLADRLTWSRGGSAQVLLAALALSIAGHVAGLFLLDARPSRALELVKPIELEVVELPPAPEATPPPPIKVAVVKPPPAPKPQAPPPPNEPPPPEAPPEPPVLVAGVTPSSTTEAGSFAAPVGNTAYGKVADSAVAPEEVKPYRAPNFTPIYQVDAEPVLLSDVKVPYPEPAKRAGVEGSVLLSVAIDANGGVTTVKVLRGVGYGLDEAAREALRRFKYRPAMKAGEPVPTELKHTYTFLLD